MLSLLKHDKNGGFPQFSNASLASKPVLFSATKLLMPTVRTELLDITYREVGPTEVLPVLLHGWPNAPRGWSAVRSACMP